MTCTVLRFCLLAVAMVSPILSISEEEYETVRTSNAAILNRLGLVPLATSDGHHRKRLAGPDAFGAREAALPGARHPQSVYGRRHGSSAHDSHVFVVKLPASQPYYSFSKPHKLVAGQQQNVTLASPNPGFRNNGKPAKIYHWNLPLVKKLNEKRKQHLAQTRKKLEAERERLKAAEKMSYFKKLAQEQLVAESQRKPSRNNDKWLSEPERVEPRLKSSGNATQLKILSASLSGNEKTYRLNDEQQQQHQQQQQQREREASRSASGQRHFGNWHEATGNEVHGSRNSLDGPRDKKHRKKSAAVSYYYAPALVGKAASTSISKHFPGNGKPKAFYVMEKSRKPIYYHPLLP